MFQTCHRQVWSVLFVSVMCSGLVWGIVAQENLVGYWALEEGGGDTALDSSKNGHHGHITNAPYVAGGWNDEGYSLEFDGASALVELGPVDVEGPGISLIAWINPEAFTINDARIITKADEWGADDHWWMMCASTILHLRRKRSPGLPASERRCTSGSKLIGYCM